MNQMYKIAGGVGVLILVLWLLLRGGENATVIKAVPERPVADSTGYTIISFGDSLTAGFGLPTHEAYPAQLEKVLKADGYAVTIINAGVSGETTRGNLERAAFIRKQNPDIVILGIGGNDALRLLPLSDTKKNLEETITTLKSGGNAPVIALLEMQAPLTAGLAYKREFDAMYEEFAAEYGLLLVPFLTTDLFFDSKNKLSDGIHYNQVGYAKAVEQHIAPVIREVLDKFRE